MVSRLHAKTNQIGKLLNNLDKYNRLIKDGESMRSPTTPNSATKSIFNKPSPTSPKEPLSIDKIPERRSNNQTSANRKSICQSGEEQIPTSDKKPKEEVAGGSENNSESQD